jgi:AbrB family looped-hinge helix DNA binding protein
METSRLSMKGQIVIPRGLRARRHWDPGIELVFEETEAGVLLRERKPFPPTRVEEGLGCTGYSGPARSDAEIDAALLDAARAERDAGGRR